MASTRRLAPRPTHDAGPGDTPTITALRRTPKQVRSWTRVHALLDAAAELLYAAGPSGTTITALAARTGQPTSSIYEWVAGDRELIAAVTERALERLHHELVAVLGAPATPDDARAAVDAALGHFLVRYRETPGLRAGLAFVDADPELSAMNIADSRRNADAIVRVIAPFPPGGPVSSDAVLMIVHLSGSLARLCDQVPSAEAKRLETQFRTLLTVLLDAELP